MTLSNNVLRLRRQYETELGDLLARQYRALKIIEGMSDEAAYGEVVRLLEDRQDNLSRMGIPPAWKRGLEMIGTVGALQPGDEYQLVVAGDESIWMTLERVEEPDDKGRVLLHVLYDDQPTTAGPFERSQPVLIRRN